MTAHLRNGGLPQVPDRVLATWRRRRGLALALLLACGLTPAPAAAQSEPAQLPEISDDLVDPGRLHGLRSLTVQRFEFDGNTVFSDAELAAVVVDQIGKPLTAADLEQAREALSQLYVDAGYISSGALLPDQEVRDGVVRFLIVEGAVSSVVVTGLDGLRESYVQDRLATSSPLNINDLRARIEQLQRGVLVDRVAINIEPGSRAGEATIAATVTENARPYRASARLDNHASRSVGGILYGLSAEHRNVTGVGDTLSAQLGFSQGETEYGFGYAVPLNAHDTTLSLSWQRSNSTVVAPPFNVLDIESTLRLARVELSQPLVSTRQREIGLSLALENRREKTALLGVPFSFTPAARRGRTVVTELRAGQTWTELGEGRVLAFSSTFGFGVDWLGATVSPSAPDGRYFRWLGQAQWLQRVALWNSQVLSRLNVQLADDTLLPSDKFALGGFATVRGYRESEITRDNAIHASLEWRIPIAQVPYPGIGEGNADGLVRLVPFADFGRGWDRKSVTPEPEVIASVGVGLQWQLTADTQAGVFWGRRLRHVTRTGGRDLQDHGIHIHLSARLF